jgi:para-nitrobenzyl esterase
VLHINDQLKYKKIKSMKILTLWIAILTSYSLQGQNENLSSKVTGPTVVTASGTMRGITEGDVSSFRGIPYAAAPVGEYRWRSPQPVTAWKDVRDATKVCAD